MRLFATSKISDLIITDSVFFVEVDNKHKAYITYTEKDNHFTLDHCEVPPSLRGKGVGREVVRKTFKYLREKDPSITIHCSYIKAVVDRLEL